MFKIVFNFLTKKNKIDTRFFERLNISDVREADDLDLYYDMFLGDAFIKSDLSEIKLDWGLPLLGLAYSIISSFVYIVKDDHDSKFRYEFPGNGDSIYFEKFGNSIAISSPYSDEKLNVGINEFKNEIKKFFIDVTEKIKSEFPKILENEHFVDLLKILDEFDKLNSQASEIATYKAKQAQNL